MNLNIDDNNYLLEKFSISDSFVFDGIILGLCLKGSARLKINFREYDLKPNTIMVIMPNQTIKILGRSDDFILEKILVSVDFITDMYLPRDFDMMINIGHLPCMEVSKDAMEDLIEYHAMIVKQYNQKEQPYRTEIVKRILNTMLLEIMGLYNIQIGHPPIPSSRVEEIVNDFFKLMRTHYKQERAIPFYADKLCITPKYLSTIIKEKTGNSALSWIHDAIIIEAKMLLRSTNLTVLQISEKLNFPNPSFFGKFFKEHTGMTPLEFRSAV